MYERLAPCTSGSMFTLGQHTLEVAPDQSITLTNQALALVLSREEAYRLLMVLLDAFGQESTSSKEERRAG